MSLRDLSDRRAARAGRCQVDGGRAGRAAGLGRRDGLRARRADHRRAARRRRPRCGGLQPVRRPHRGRGGAGQVRHRPVVLGPRPGARGPRPRRHERDRARAAHAVRGRPGGRADAGVPAVPGRRAADRPHPGAAAAVTGRPGGPRPRPARRGPGGGRAHRAAVPAAQPVGAGVHPGASWRACATWSCGTGRASSATRCTPPWYSRVPPTCPTPPWAAPRRTPRRSCRRPRRGTCPGCAVPRWSRAPRRTPASSAPCPSSPSTAPRRWVWSAPSRPTARARRGWRSCGDVSTATAPSSLSSSPSCCRRCATRRLEATYLAWLDVRGLGLQDPAGLALRDGRVLVNDGTRFGPGGAGHVRVNLATSPDRLDRIVRRLASAWTPPPYR